VLRQLRLEVAQLVEQGIGHRGPRHLIAASITLAHGFNPTTLNSGFHAGRSK
jgi:hypothetical protein